MKSKTIKAPPGFLLVEIVLSNGIKKLVARSQKSYRSPKTWNGKKWVTTPNCC